MRYQDAVTYIYSFVDYEKLTSPSYSKKERSPARFKRFLVEIGAPEEGFSAIHITGTKGKGSVAVMLTNIFKEAGLCVGTYTSPHLVDVRERIMLNGELIEREEFAELFNQILPSLEKRKKEKSYRTVFEILTAIALLYFKKKRVDIGVVEVGLGGRLDATNIFKKSTAVITNISLDHTRVLGNTLYEIAEDKSEIIKENSLVVSSPQNAQVLEILKRKALQRKCKFIYSGDYLYNIKYRDESSTTFDLRTNGTHFRELRLALPGTYQVENALTAIAAIEGLRQRDERFSKILNEESLRKGLGSVKWRGRLETLRRFPYLLVDGAHNLYSMEVLSREIRDLFDYQRLILIFGVNRDKQIKQMLDAICTLADEIILTRVDFPRSADPELIGDMLDGRSHKTSTNVREALEIAFRIAKPKDLILVTGSLYLVGEAIKETEMTKDLQE